MLFTDLLPTLIWFFIGGITAYCAKQRGRNPLNWLILGLLFGLLSTIALYCMPILATVAAPEKPPAPIDNTEWYYVDANHQQQGPVSRIVLDDLKRKGIVNDNTYVWHEGMQDWILLDNSK